MNIIDLVLLFFAPIALLTWTLKFKKYFALLSAGPILVVVVATLALNSDPHVSFQVAELGCPANSTSCAFQDTPVVYDILPNTLRIVNITVMITMFMVIFVVFRRVTNIFTKTKAEDEE